MILSFKIKHWIGLMQSLVRFESLSAIFILFMAGCSEDALQTELFPSERLEAGVSTRNVPIVVTICTDAYITIGGGSFGSPIPCIREPLAVPV